MNAEIAELQLQLDLGVTGGSVCASLSADPRGIAGFHPRKQARLRRRAPPPLPPPENLAFALSGAPGELKLSTFRSGVR